MRPSGPEVCRHARNRKEPPSRTAQLQLKGYRQDPPLSRIKYFGRRFVSRYVFAKYWPMIPKQSNCAPPINRITAISDGQPATGSPKQAARTITNAAKADAITHKTRPSTEAIARGAVLKARACWRHGCRAVHAQPPRDGAHGSEKVVRRPMRGLELIARRGGRRRRRSHTDKTVRAPRGSSDCSSRSSSTRWTARASGPASS